MKKTIITLCLLIVAISTLAAVERAPILFGVDGTFAYFFWKLAASDSLSQDLCTIGGGFFIDFKYLRIGASFGNLFYYGIVYENGSYREASSINSVSGYFIDGYALLKTNIRVSSGISFWPGAGLLYSHALKIDSTNDGIDDIAPTDRPNDFYLLVGGGFNFSAGLLVFSPSLLLGYNLTPTQTDTSLPSYITASGLKLISNIGFAFKI